MTMFLKAPPWDELAREVYKALEEGFRPKKYVRYMYIPEYEYINIRIIVDLYCLYV